MKGVVKVVVKGGELGREDQRWIKKIADGENHDV